MVLAVCIITTDTQILNAFFFIYLLINSIKDLHNTPISSGAAWRTYLILIL